MVDVETQSPKPATPMDIWLLLFKNEMTLFGFLLNLCGVISILIACTLTLYHCGWLGQPFDIQEFGDGIGKLIQDDLIATGILASGMGIKSKLSVDK